MKLNTVFLADHGSVREGTLGVLGGFVNQLHRGEFPASMGVDLVAIATTVSEEIGEGEATDAFHFWCGEPGVDEPLFEGRGEIVSTFGHGRQTHFPMVFDLRNAMIPNPGQFIINFRLNDGEVHSFPFWAETPPTQAG
ncbi:hypothetical protein [Leucobacter sp. NPDC077196]|uniref:DUF6941 family protein n=1 Tax=Leucobacter sp. NPDC077196 TaxID=3154959 RepID=UPI00343F1934